MTDEQKADCSNEIELLQKIQHENIVKYYESFSIGAKLYIKMEYCPGRDLARLLQEERGGLSEEKIWSIFMPTVKGI